MTGRPLGTPGEEALTSRRFLLRLHLAHGYLSKFDARWAWAVVVDQLSRRWWAGGSPDS